MKRKFNYYVIGLWIILCGIIFQYTHSYTHEKMDELKSKKFETITKNLKEKTQILINNKKQSMTTLALSLSHDPLIKQALITKNTDNLKLQDFSNQLKEYSEYKNVWFHLIDKNGIRRYRSWTEEHGDNVSEYRSDIEKLIKVPQILTSISVDNFDMSFKAMIPMYKNKEFLGIFEVITHFNSIAKDLLEDNINAIFLVDKQFRQKLTKAFSKNFVDNYYVANISVRKDLLIFLSQNNVQTFTNLKNNEYLLFDDLDLYATSLDIFDIDKKKIGYVILIADIDKITSLNDIKQIHKDSIVYVSALLIILSILGYLVSNRRYTLKIKEQENKISTIIDSQPSIIIITDGKYLKEANQRFLKFFEQYKSLEEFKKEHDCICDFFEKDIKDDDYITFQDGWLEYIFSNPEKDLKVAMVKDSKRYHFSVKAKNITTMKNEQLDIVTFIDITKEIDYLTSQKTFKNALVKIGQIKSNDVKENILNILGILVDTMKTSQTNIWLFNNDKNLEKSFSSMKKIQRNYEKQTLLRKSCPIFFDEIDSKNIINEKDALNSKYLEEIKDIYLIPNNITSIIFIPIVNNFSVIGVLSLENSDLIKHWSQEEIDFLLAVCGEISLSLEIDNRIKIEKQLLKTTTEQNLLLSLFDKGDFVLVKLKNDNKLSIEYLSESIYKLLGYSKDEVKIKDSHYTSYIYKSDLNNFLEEIRLNNINKSIYFKHNPYRLVTKNNNIKFVLDYKICVRDTNNKVINYICYIVDITEEREKDRLLLEQTKMAALGEMIGNIAHQWRQPLSVISTIASGFLIQKEMDLLEDEHLIEGCQLITSNTQYLSKTIDDFRNFILGENIKVLFNLEELFDSFSSLIETSRKDNHINIVFNIKENIQMYSLKNELNQCLINLYNNAKDKLVENNIDEKMIFINTSNDDCFLTIEFKDNAGGINLNIIDKIFEPYFTTKHQSLGKGLGLNITYRLITEAMNGLIEVSNENYIYNNENFTGAKFVIKLPLSQ